MAFFPEAFPATLNPPVLPSAPVVTPTHPAAGQVTLSWPAVTTPANADPAYKYRAQVAQNVTTDPLVSNNTPATDWDTSWSGTITSTFTGSVFQTNPSATNVDTVLRSRGVPNAGGACAEGDVVMVRFKVRGNPSNFPVHVTFLTNATGTGDAQFFATGVHQQTTTLSGYGFGVYTEYTLSFVVPAGDNLYNVFFRSTLGALSEYVEWDDVYQWLLPAAAWTETANTSITFSGLSDTQNYTGFVQALNLAGWSAITPRSIIRGATTTLNGGGTLTATGTREATASASMSGGGTLTAAGDALRIGTATMNGGGTLTASGVVTKDATATLNGGGTLTATGTRIVGASATMNGAGTLTATGVPTKVATATFNGAGTFLAEYSGGIPATASMNGGGTLTATGVRSAVSTATMTGGGTLTATAVRTTFGTVSLAGGGTLTATATRVMPAGAALAAGGTLTATGVRVVPSTATLTGGGTLLATGTIPVVLTGTASFTGGGTLVALADLIDGILRIAEASLPAPFTQMRDLWGRGGAGRLAARHGLATQRFLLLEQPSATYPQGRVVATSEPVRLDGWDDVIEDPQGFTTTTSSWQAEVLRDNGYDLEVVL